MPGAIAIMAKTAIKTESFIVTTIEDVTDKKGDGLMRRNGVVVEMCWEVCEELKNESL